MNAQEEATLKKWVSEPPIRLEVADLPQSVCVGKDGVVITHQQEGWVPFWRLTVFRDEKKADDRKDKPSDANFFLDKKEQLTAWWLQHIEESADAYLVQQWGFDFAAIPYHYIDQPPKSMPAIKKNLDIVHTILSALSHTPAQPPSETVEARRRQVRGHLMTHLVNPVNASVYHAIDEYSHGVKTFLWHQCHHELDPYEFSMSDLFFVDLAESNLPSLEEVYLGFKARKERESAKWDRSTVFIADQNSENLLKQEKINHQIAYVESLVHELWYIREMKRLEKGFFTEEGSINPNNTVVGTFLGGAAAEKKSSSVSDIVPISGLILGKLHRLENELKTIMEHWGRRK